MDAVDADDTISAPIKPTMSFPSSSSTTSESELSKTSVYLLFDERMTHHCPLDWQAPPDNVFPCHRDDIPEGYIFENPERIRRIYQGLMNLEHRLIAQDPDTAENRRFLSLPCLPAAKETIVLAHSALHYDQLSAIADQSLEELVIKSEVDDDVYYNHDTFLAATLSCGGVVHCVDAVTSPQRQSTRAIAVVRPPGHHACQEKQMGFCYLNNVAVAAKHAIAIGRANRVCIVDWDIHHGNGTQDLTYDDPQILYMSLHRYQHHFFPGTGCPSEVSDGTNVNIAWTKGNMGNAEYAAAFSEILLPILVDWKPDLILISSGFDAAKGDLLGDCALTPDMYYAMTNCLLQAAGVDVPMVVALEGGYNVDVNAKCMEAVAEALLDEPHDGDASVEVTKEVTGEDQDITETRSRRLQLGRNELVSYWKYKENSLNIKPSAVRCLHTTMDAIERAPLWKGQLTLRRLDSNERTIRTRAVRKQEELDELNIDLKSFSLK